MNSVDYLVIVVLCGCSAVAGYFYGTIFERLKASDRDTRSALQFAVDALRSAEGIKNSTVIQRIVEKYNIVKEPTLTKEGEKLQAEFDAMADPYKITTPTERAKREARSELHGFDDIDDKPLGGQKPEDLT